MATEHGRRGEDCAVQGYFKGLTRDETAKECNVGTGQVSKIWKELEAYIGEAGTKNRKLAIELKNDKLTVAEALVGVRVSSQLLKLGEDINKLESFVKNFYAASVERGLKSGVLVGLASRLFDVEKSTGLHFEKITKKVEEDSKKLTELQGGIGKAKKDLETIKKEHEDEKKSARKQIQELNKEIDSLTKEKKTTKEALGRYVAARGALQRRGLDLDEELPKAVNVLSNLKEQGHDTKKIIDQLQAHRSLKTDVEDLRKILNPLQSKKQSLESELGSLKEQINQNKGVLDNLNWMEKQGVTRKRTSELKDRILEISSARGIDPKDAMNVFFESLKEYDAKAGFEHQIKVYETVATSLKLKIEGLNLDKDNLEKKNAVRKDAVEALESIQKRGIKKEGILLWARILDKAGLSASELSQGIEKYGGLTQACAEKEKENLDLEEKQKVLKGGIESLKSEISTIKGSIQTLTETGVKEITKISTDSKTLINTSIAEFKKQLEGFAADLIKYGEHLGKLDALKPIIELLENKDFDEFELHTAIAMLLEKYMQRISKKAQNALGRLMDEAIRLVRQQALELARNNP